MLLVLFFYEIILAHPFNKIGTHHVAHGFILDNQTLLLDNRIPYYLTIDMINTTNTKTFHIMAHGFELDNRIAILWIDIIANLDDQNTMPCMDLYGWMSFVCANSCFIVLKEVVREWPKGSTYVCNQGFKEVCPYSQKCEEIYVISRIKITKSKR